MELQVLENKIPLKAYPEKDLDTLLTTQFKYWLSNLLSIKADKEDAMDGAISVIKKKFWSLGLHEVKKCFEMYALGELDIEPRSNHIDIILVGQIFNAYKKHSRTEKPKQSPEEKEKEYKELEDSHYVITLFDFYIQENKIPKDSFWVYSYLESRLDDFEFSDKEKITLFNIGKQQKLTDEEAKGKAKRTLIMRYFDRLHAKGKHIKDLI